MMAEESLRTLCEGRLAGMRTDRYSWWVHWGQLAQYILPRRYRWLVTPNQMNKGSAINGAIIDSTGTIAARVLASGMMTGITSPTRPWFKLRVEGYDGQDVNPVNLWLAEVERRMMRVFQESNFYNCIAIVYMDLGVFATGPMIIHEDYENVINCVNPCAGEYYLAVNGKGTNEVLYREIVKTVGALVQEFGIDNVSDPVKIAHQQGGASLTQEIAIVHAIEPNIGASPVPKNFKYRELYWERGSTNKEKWLRTKGYHECPFIAPRWDVIGNDAYGNGCPGMDALGDIKQLQQETKRKAQAIDKLANPPMIADVELKNAPASTLPGGVTYITKKDGVGFQPAYQNFRPPIEELFKDIALVQQRIQNIFFNDLFLMISQLQTVRTATEIDARREEKLVMLGPVLERFQTEALDPVIDRVFAIMERGNLLPPPPPEISKAPIQVEYVSMLAAAQAAVSATGIERTLQLAGGLVAVDQTVMDNINIDKTIKKYGFLMAMDPDLLNSVDDVATIRKNRQEQKKADAVLPTVSAAADAGKVLSDTNVGGGQNALEAMMGTGGQ